MMLKIPAAFLITALALCPASFGDSRLSLDLETGMAFSGYNDIRIPGSTGTLFSLSRELESGPVPFGRLRLGMPIGGRHSVSVLIAPLRIKAVGKAGKDIAYNGATFTEGTQLSSTYRFDSYRLSYRWDAWRSDRLTAGIGLTAKIRDASITLEGGGARAEKKNTGFVPIVNFRLAWRSSGRLTGIFEGDALAAPQGRAEDVFAGAAYRLNKRASLKAGYRILEGGADNEEVYTFSLFHYAVVGALVDL